MTIKSDKWISTIAENEDMIEPFQERQCLESGGKKIIA